ncbi:MAG: hypothetical protein V3U96_03575 [Paracoccaceae bacterium]
MSTKHRWLTATITFTEQNKNVMPWALRAERKAWAKRCSDRAAAKAS